MKEGFLSLFIFANIFNWLNWGGKFEHPKSVPRNKIQASIYDVSSFKLVAKKLPMEVAEQITATNVLVRELGSGVVYEKNAQESKSIASITKLMTALISYQIYEEDEKFKISADAIEVEGEAGGFLSGEIFKRNDLIKTALIGSSNDAAFALAEKNELEKFIQLMNLKAKELKMTETQFVDSVGLSKYNKSSLDDLYNLVEYTSRTAPEIFNFSKTEKFLLSGKYKRTIENLDYLIPLYKGYIIASKTGFTPEAGECLILVLKFEKSSFLFVGILNSKNRFEDAERLIISLRELYK